MNEFSYFKNDDGLLLEGVFNDPGSSRGQSAALLLHPHPAYGGSMENIIIRRMESALMTAGIPTFRFNFRGVGRSQGKFDHGRGELSDALAALAELENRLRIDASGITVFGYSFGAFVGLKLACTTPLHSLICFAPPVKVMSEYHETELLIPQLTIPSLLLAGDQDLVCDIEALASLCKANLHCRFHVIPGANHFFLKGNRTNRESVDEHLNELVATAMNFLTESHGGSSTASPESLNINY